MRCVPLSKKRSSKIDILSSDGSSSEQCNIIRAIQFDGLPKLDTESSFHGFTPPEERRHAHTDKAHRVVTMHTLRRRFENAFLHTLTLTAWGTRFAVTV